MLPLVFCCLLLPESATFSCFQNCSQLPSQICVNTVAPSRARLNCKGWPSRSLGLLRSCFLGCFPEGKIINRQIWAEMDPHVLIYSVFYVLRCSFSSLRLVSGMMFGAAAALFATCRLCTQIIFSSASQ